MAFDLIPDHDGRARPGLKEALDEIDADRRLYFAPGARRLFRAVTAAKHGDEVRLWAELQAGIAEVADELGMTRAEVTRLTEPATDRLTRRRPGLN